MDDGLSDDIKKKFMLPMTTDLQDHKEKVFNNAAISPTVRMPHPYYTLPQVLEVYLKGTSSVSHVFCRVPDGTAHPHKHYTYLIWGDSRQMNYLFSFIYDILSLDYTYLIWGDSRQMNYLFSFIYDILSLD